MGARVYDPYTGTFLQTDPLPGADANAYGYTDGDPVNQTDLTGRSDDDEDGGPGVAPDTLGETEPVSAAEAQLETGDGPWGGTGGTEGEVTPHAGGIEVSPHLAGEGYSYPEVTFGHRARHLEGTGLSQGSVETRITTQVTSQTRGATVTGSFGGRVIVDGTTIEYRGYPVGSQRIHIGTYYRPK